MKTAGEGLQLSVAVIVESLTIPEWVAWAVARIDAMDTCELVAVVPVAGAADTRASAPALARLAYRAYGWLDALAFGAAPAMRPANLAPVASGRTAHGDLGSLDVVISFLPAGRTAWDGPPPRHGVWTVVPMDDGRPDAAPVRFWELDAGNGTATSALVRLEDGRAQTMARATTPIDPLSLGRTRDAAAWATARLVLGSLRTLRRDGRLCPLDGDLGKPYGVPRAAATIHHAARTAARGVAARTRSAWRRGEWFVAVRVRSAGGAVRGPLAALPNPRGRYLADPFVIEVDGRHHLFVEDYSLAAGRAAISTCQAAPDGTWSAPRVVLARPHHLSYPFVFEHDGEIYLLPETGQAGRVELYRAVDFPDRWELDRLLLDGLTAVDATLHVEGGTLWLFACVVNGPGDPGELHLWSSESLDGDWRPHPRNPIVTDPGSARPAGRLFRRGGELLRPGQDCSRCYGEAIVLSRVDVLSADDYHESPVERIEPDWAPEVDRTHTYTFTSRYECLDGHRRVRRLTGPKSQA